MPGQFRLSGNFGGPFPGDRVVITDGPLETFCGIVETFDPSTGKASVSVRVFGRVTPVELEYWQIRLH